MSERFPDESDVRLWHTDMPGDRAHHWLKHMFLVVPMADLERDEEWARAHDWQFFYGQDGRKIVKARGKTFTLPRRQ